MAETPVTRQQEIHRFGRCEVRAATRELFVDGQSKAVGARAFDVLLALIERRDRVVLKSELLDLAWGELVVEENNLHVQVSALRRLLGESVIATIPGRGYRFAARLESEPPADATLPASAIGAGSLPEFGEPLIGRDAEVAAIRQMVARHRLVTIAGAGGMGKTRLAAAACGLLRSENESIAWVELAPLSHPDLVPHVIAEKAGIPLTEGKTAVESLAAGLRRRTMILVLDNAEHLVDSVAAVVNAVLRSAADVRLLVTSRVPLKLPEETTLRLEGLPVPDGATDAAGAAAYGAVRLFCARAHAASRHFLLTDSNAAQVINVCRQLDGMPLAIEFAAARVSSLGLAAVAQQLSQRIDALGAATSAGPARQQTMRATFDWSHGLLSPDEQALFCRLGVFSGGFTLAAAQAMAKGMHADPWHTSDLLASLVDKSMVAVGPDEPPRYNLLETARAYAQERLEGSGASNDARRRHAEFFAFLLDEVYEGWFIRPEDQWRPTIWREIDNVSDAASWCLGPRGDRALAIRLAATLLPAFLAGRERRIEARALVDAALDLVDKSTPPRTAARLHVAKGMLYRIIDRPVSDASLQRAVALFRTTDDRRGLAHALLEHARSLAAAGDMAATEQALDDAEAILPSLRAPALPALLSMNRGYAKVMSGRPEEAVVEFKRSADQFEAARTTTRVLQALSDLGDALWSLGRLDEAEIVLRDVIRRSQGLDAQVLAVPMTNLAGVLIERGDLDEAATIAREALPISDNRWTAFGALALRLALLGKHASAARLYGCTLALYAGASNPIEPNEARLCGKVFELLRANLPAEELKRLVEEGGRMDEDVACEVAFEVWGALPIR